MGTRIIDHVDALTPTPLKGSSYDRCFAATPCCKQQAAILRQPAMIVKSSPVGLRFYAVTSNFCDVDVSSVVSDDCVSVESSPSRDSCVSNSNCNPSCNSEMPVLLFLDFEISDSNASVCTFSTASVPEEAVSDVLDEVVPVVPVVLEMFWAAKNAESRPACEVALTDVDITIPPVLHQKTI